MGYYKQRKRPINKAAMVAMNARMINNHIDNNLQTVHHELPKVDNLVDIKIKIQVKSSLIQNLELISSKKLIDVIAKVRIYNYRFGTMEQPPEDESYEVVRVFIQGEDVSQCLKDEDWEYIEKRVEKHVDNLRQEDSKLDAKQGF